MSTVACYVGSFVKRSGTGTQDITGLVDEFNLPFTPKGFIFWSVCQTATGFADADQHQIYGFSDGTHEICISHLSQFGSLDTSVGYRNDAAICIEDINETFDSIGHVSAMASGQFTINWTTAAGFSGILIDFIAFGGDTLALQVGDAAMSGSTGNQTISGLSVDPVVTILLPSLNTSVPVTTAGFGPNGFGWFTASAQGAASNDTALVGSPKLRRYQRTDRCLVAAGAGGIACEASAVSLNSDGFTINWLTAHSGRIAYLVISGISAVAGAIVAPTTSGSASISGSTRALAALFLGDGNIASTSIDTVQSSLALGAVDMHGHQRVNWSVDGDNAGGTERYEATNAAIVSAERFSALKSAGSVGITFTGCAITWTITTSDNAQFLYLIIGRFTGTVPVSTPMAAQTPCAPQAQVTNGGKGKAGCNVGGVGGGQQYNLGDGVGTVPQHADPDDGEVLTGDVTRSTLEPWIELVHEDYPSLVKTTYRRAFEELADDSGYEGGRKESGMLAIGDIEHGLGNEQGGFEAGTATLQLSDIRDRLFRDLSADQDIDGDEYRVKLASDAARAAHIAPRILQRGIVQQAALESMLQSQITGVDWLFSDFGPFGPGRQDPNWTFGDLGSAAPDMTGDTKTQPITLLYGEKSDENASSPLGGSPAGNFAKGLLPGYFLGRFDLTGLVPDPPVSTGSTLEQVVAELQASVDAHTTVADWSSIIGVADAITLEGMGTVPDSYTGLAGVIGYGDLNVLLSMGTTAPPAATEWGFVATGLGPWFRYTGVYGSDLGCGDALQTHDRIKLDPATRADILVPGINWPFGNPYFELTNPDTGRTFWLTGVFVTGPLLDDHLNGVVTLAFNAIGIEDVGDGSGLPIMRIEDAKQHRLENHWINQWSSGAYATALVFPQFEDGTAMVRSSSFTARQQFFIDQLGNDGILVSEYADTRQSNLDIVRQWNTDTESKIGINQHGQIIDFGFDEFVDPSAWPRLNHVTDIFGPLVRTAGEERENVVTGSCDWDPDFDKARAGPFTYTSSAGIAKYKGRIRQGQPINSKMLDNTDHFQWILQRRLSRLEFGLTMIQVQVPIDPWLTVDVGEGILLNSEDGPGPLGYVDEPCIIMRRKISLQTRLMTLTLWDISGLLGS